MERSIDKLEAERQDLLGLADIGKVINSSLKLDDVLRIVMDTLIRLTEAERGFLMLRDQETGELTTRVARNWEQESIASNEFAVSQTVINRVAEQGEPILTTNAQEDARFDSQESIIAYKLRSIVCVPLKLRERLTGVIYADNRIQTGLFTESDLALLLAFANQAAVAIENARLFESVQQTLSEVTELKNLMDNIFASIASGVITTNIQEQITLCNRATENILEIQSSEVIGSKLNDAFPYLGNTLSSTLNSVSGENRSVMGMEISSELLSRKRVDLSLNISPLKDAQENTQGVAIVLDDLTEKKKLEAQHRLFERMVSPAVINQLDPDELQLGGKRSTITTLFADIRGFTSFSENLAPEDLVSVLNRYLAAAADAILIEEGTIDKFLGDAVMAWFNAPILQTDHKLRAVRAAIGIRQTISNLHKKLPQQYHLDFGVGIHTGDAVLGVIGTEKRIEYTAIGDSVNTAKRIQENSGPNQILISSVTYAEIGSHVIARPTAPIHAKGKSHPIEVYEVVNLK
ncbi:MAG: adenylate/guanylate cyclase domain-containing protein [Chloroflexota bacterium]|nr:adenylate/guanylate cyclase domain-containing protein [Chloroflexota bacterium]